MRAKKSEQENPACPQCGSKRIWKNGHHGKVQRYLCADCARRFSESSEFPKRLAQFHAFKQNLGIYYGDGRVDAPERGAKNLTETCGKLVTTAHAEGAIDKAKSAIVNFAWWMKREGYAESTIEGRIRLLKVLLKKGADLSDPWSIKDVIAQQSRWSNGRKELAVDLYTSYLKLVGGKWDPPRYRRVRKLPFIPTNAEIDQLIAGCGPKTSTFLQLLKETGTRCGEAWKLEWTDLDVENSTVRITPEKGSNPRIFKLSGKLLAMLNALPRTSEKVFGGTKLRTMRRTFEYSRKRLAQQLKNPRLLKISFHTFRHFKATMEYHKTKDILHVMDILGHRNIQNTLIYTHLVDFQDDDYVSKVSKTVQEDCKLIEAGFEYVTERDGLKIYRKRK